MPCTVPTQVNNEILRMAERIHYVTLRALKAVSRRREFRCRLGQIFIGKSRILSFPDNEIGLSARSIRT